ncbi:MAG: hypothetical protein A2161_14415 [Candidatus Schekmanbacteria bacterium RBG_13_48_7]|uniref:Uncharacterized protein n=1 Tax=Candidatus Schekmanbacteria bacterium RBG_13_48_7 TaxID=1817878 RepID=A0A1F7S044_9BACT|nr:MAG: hypothetical protein A2161_14415 [Candidatus Schekmanbacteria bacterium RBG_13_48_7]
MGGSIQALKAWEREWDWLPWVSKTQPTTTVIKPHRSFTHELTPLNLHKSKKLLSKNCDKVILEFLGYCQPVTALKSEIVTFAKPRGQII